MSVTYQLCQLHVTNVTYTQKQHTKRGAPHAEEEEEEEGSLINRSEEARLATKNSLDARRSKKNSLDGHMAIKIRSMDTALE